MLYLITPWQLLGQNASIGQAPIDVDDLGDRSITLDTFGFSFQDNREMLTIGQAPIDVDDLGDTSITLDTFGFSFQDYGEML